MKDRTIEIVWQIYRTVDGLGASGQGEELDVARGLVLEEERGDHVLGRVNEGVRRAQLEEQVVGLLFEALLKICIAFSPSAESTVILVVRKSIEKYRTRKGERLV